MVRLHCTQLSTSAICQWDAGNISGGGVRRSAEDEASSGTHREHLSEAINTGRVKHTEIGTASLIRDSLWNEAIWKGTAFGYWVHDDVTVPVLAPWFENALAAGKIFSLWREEIGIADTKDLLRVTIIRGISQKNSTAYRVVLGINPAAVSDAAGTRLAIITSRMNTMEPSSSHNLNAFWPVTG